MRRNSGQIPRELDDTTSDWLNQLVFSNHDDNKVSDLTDTSICDDRGFLSQTVRAETKWPRSVSHLPYAFIAKVRPNTEESKNAEAVLNSFFREVRGYSDVAHETPQRRGAQLRDAMAQRFFASAVEVDALSAL